jgi:retron-type reverse transcriptase
MVYVDRMLRAGLPVVFSFGHLAALLGRTPSYLASVVAATERHYREFSIPKRSGGRRTISAPYPALLECQQWINRYVLRKTRVHDAAHGFIRGRSIISNAKAHLRKPCLLKMDICDFFPSVTINRVIHVFQNLGFPNNVSFYLARLCCLQNCLPQGAATSPALSNAVVYRMDCRLAGLAESYRLSYTRYADDLTFSGDRIPVRFLEIVETIVAEEGFKVRGEKTRFCRGAGRKIVTGLSVSGDDVRVPKSYKRGIRQAVHYLLKFGQNSHTSKRKIRNPFYLESLYGKLVFWGSVEPENAFVSLAITNIAKLLAGENPD